MRIKDIELLELFLETVCEASESQSQDDDAGTTALTVPGPEANRACSMEQQLGNRANLMEQLADRYAASGQSKLALATRRLARALEEDHLLSSDDGDRHQRLLDYVYPVV